MQWLFVLNDKKNIVFFEKLLLCRFFYVKIYLAVKNNVDRWLSWSKAHDWKSCER